MKVRDMSDASLIELWALVEHELRRRGIATTVGEMGEINVIQQFNDTPGLPNLLKAPTGTKNVDALSRDGDRYSIKSIQRGRKTGTVYPDGEDSSKQLFEYLVVAKLDSNFNLEWIRQFSWKQFVSLRSWDSRMNAWYVGCSKKTVEQGELIYERR